ncbi:hypothetical protein A2Z33_05595 [Candidatus Gottesmanbacteria bacterium RBG_16_52_11]|uniref:Glycosyltransferase 2-like domain-containing protein n=1 Tax=Candidatus Gottesmanbacteria bacterium RBG_16_52_11 TaxID=1798374 RepID=A0A1F5YNF4_9BACT|nr:MAG: hypothetical protein A2Z33_05595 [Candidatus Gottesmanbacteria bacterium RBG_16_52_11]
MEKSKLRPSAKNSGSRYQLAVVIPAYNESGNLRQLIPALLKRYPGIRIIVVDDSTGSERTETEDIARSYLNRGVNLISRNRKSGRGSAVLAGLRLALKYSDTGLVAEMDADLAHDPEDLSGLIGAASKYDVVIGSRYLPGSAITDWPVYRLVQSRIINLLLRYWLGIPISDFTNGLRVYRRPAAQYLTRIRLRETGFILLSETVYRMKQAGFRIGEVPARFTDRKLGKSNADWKELLASLRGALRIRTAGWSLPESDTPGRQSAESHHQG